MRLTQFVASLACTLIFPSVASAQLALTVDAPVEGALLRDSTPRFSGTTANDASVTVTVGEVLMATATDTGDWVVEAGTALEEGAHTAVVVATDGVDTSPEISVSFTVDTIPPALVIASPTEGMTIEPTAMVAGATDPGLSLEIQVDDVIFAAATAGDDGQWSAELRGLRAGVRKISVFVRDVAGNLSELSVVVTVVVPVIGEVADGPFPEGPDSDEDGLSDALEQSIGTDVDSVDTDADGLSDGDEFNEYQTNPLSEDTDNDGISDPDELAAGTNPRLQDSDGGGVPDGVEVENGNDPLDPSDDYAEAALTAGEGCSTVGFTPNSVWFLLLAIVFKRRRRC